MSDLDLVTTDELIQELGRRHTGDTRALCVVSCTPEDGKPGMTSFRTVFIAKEKKLLLAAVHKALKMLYDEIQEAPQ